MKEYFLGKVSAIVPVYNVEKYLSRCLDSIINQTYKNIEIILVNDGSNDDSLEICNYYKNKDKRIKLVNKTNGGLSSARNSGLRIATGEYILFIDSDDWILEETINELIYYAQKYKVDFVRYSPVYAGYSNIEDGTPWKFPDERQIEPGYYDKERIRTEIFDRLFITDKLTLGPIVSAVLSLYSREFLLKYNLYFDENIKYSEDVIFNAKVVYNTKSFYFIKDSYYYYYYYNNGSITKSFNQDKWISCKSLSYELEKYFNSIEMGYFSNQLRLMNFYNILSGVGNVKGIKNIKDKVTYIDSIVEDDFTKESMKFKFPNNISWKLKVILWCIKHKLKLALIIIMR